MCTLRVRRMRRSVSMNELHGLSTASLSDVSVIAQRRHPSGMFSFRPCSPPSTITRPPIIVNSVPVRGIATQLSFDENV